MRCPRMHAQVHVCVLRALAEDENRAQRAQRGLDLALLDAVTWPEFLWDTLRVLGDPLGVHAACSGSPVVAVSAPACSGAGPAPPGLDAAAAVCALPISAMLVKDCMPACVSHAWVKPGAVKTGSCEGSLLARFQQCGAVKLHVHVKVACLCVQDAGPSEPEAEAGSGEDDAAHARADLGQGRLRFPAGAEQPGEGDVAALLGSRTRFEQRGAVEYYSLPAGVKARCMLRSCALDSLCCPEHGPAVLMPVT